jgi:hypothetical protein
MTDSKATALPQASRTVVAGPPLDQAQAIPRLVQILDRFEFPSEVFDLTITQVDARSFSIGIPRRHPSPAFREIVNAIGSDPGLVGFLANQTRPRSDGVRRTFIRILQRQGTTTARVLDHL